MAVCTPLLGPVVVLGPPGAGKSTVVPRAAAQLGIAALDLDEAIAGHAGTSVADVFAQEGEASFRVREHQALQQALRGDTVLIAAGAGIVDTALGRALLSRALVVELTVDSAIALARLAGERVRPWLAAAAHAADPTAARAAFYAAREQHRPAWRRALSQVQISANGDVDAVLAALVAAVQQLRPLRGAHADVLRVDRSADPAWPCVAMLSDLRDVRATVEAHVPDAIAVLDGGLVHAARDSGHAAHSAVAALMARPHVVVPGGEAQKTFAHTAALTAQLAALHAGRSRGVVAIGGGALLDAAGLAASLLHRGTPWVAVPTTLLAMVDAGLGGKVAVDVEVDGTVLKNLAGAVHPPQCTVIAPQLLVGLPAPLWRQGAAEMLKHAFLSADAPADGSAHTDDAALSAIARGAADAASVARAVERSVAIKRHTVAVDGTERGLRAALNLGHTVGHAVEAVAQVAHGDAVLWGLRAMLALSVRCAGLDPTVAATLQQRITELHPPPLPPLSRAHLHAALAHDKKAGRFVLLRAPGVLVTCVPDAADIDAALDVLA